MVHLVQPRVTHGRSFVFFQFIRIGSKVPDDGERHFTMDLQKSGFLYLRVLLHKFFLLYPLRFVQEKTDLFD